MKAVFDSYGFTSVEDNDLEDILGCKSKQENRSNEELNRIDKRIEEDRVKANEREEQKDRDFEALKERIARRAEESKRNAVRAEALALIGLEKIKIRAESLLPRIEEDEKSSELSKRRKLYIGSNEEQQSLFYKQVWEPFTDEQHGTVSLVCHLINYNYMFRSSNKSPVHSEGKPG